MERDINKITIQRKWIKRKKSGKPERGIFITNIASKAYEIVKKIQNKDTIIEKQRQSHKNTYLYFAGAEKCLNKLWMKDSLTEMGEIGYNRNIKMLYKMNKKAQIIVDTTVGQTESINIKKIVKQGSIFGPIMCCATTSKVNNRGDSAV